MTPAMRTHRMPALVPIPYAKFPLTQFALAADEVCYVGEPIAIVIADTRYIAEDAAAAVEIDYEILPAASDCRDAVAQTRAARSSRTRRDNEAALFKVGYGDIASAFRDAAHVFTEKLWHHRGCGHSLETRAALASIERDGRLCRLVVDADAASRQALACRDAGARPRQSIRVIAPDVGGGFGPKAIFYAEEAVVAQSALLLGRPVKWTEDRREHFLATTQERDQYWSIEIALDAQAKTPRRARHDAARHRRLPSMGRGDALHCGHHRARPLCRSRLRAECHRGLHQQGADHAGERRGPAPGGVRHGAAAWTAPLASCRSIQAEIRRRNLIPPSAMPYRVGLTFRDGKPVVYDSGDYPATLEKALALSRYRDFPHRQKEALEQGRHIGIGIGSYVEGTGLGPFEGVTVRVQDNGKVLVRSGAAPHGQGHQTMFQQIVADELSVPLGDIAVVLGDTDAIAMGVGTFASRITANAGPAALLAAQIVRARALKLAARALSVTEADLVLADGRAEAKSGNRPSIGLGDLAKLSQGYPGFSFAPGDVPGSRAHRVFHASSGRLLQRHACR